MRIHQDGAQLPVKVVTMNADNVADIFLLPGDAARKLAVDELGNGGRFWLEIRAAQPLEAQQFAVMMGRPYPAPVAADVHGEK